MTEANVGLLQPEKYTLPKRVYQKYIILYRKKRLIPPKDIDSRV
jgi:hypothetical protein